MPFEYIPYNSNGKYIYIARNPFEVCLSYYKDVCSQPKLFGVHTFEEWVQLFIKGYTPFGDYFDHIISWYRRRDEDNVLFITYEQMKSHPKEYILKIAEFIGKDFGLKLEKSEHLINKILYYTDFDYMKGIPLILPKNLDVAVTKGYDAKKNLDLVHNDKGYEMRQFFNVGKVGYSYESFTETQIRQIQDKANHKFSSIPQLLHIWRSFGVKV